MYVGKYDVSNGPLPQPSIAKGIEQGFGIELPAAPSPLDRAESSASLSFQIVFHRRLLSLHFRSVLPQQE